MTTKHKRILRRIDDGKSYYEICRELGISQSNLHSTIYQMRKAGVRVEKRKVMQAARSLSPKQREILVLYSQIKTIPEIAKQLNITCQTVMNQASQGFKRLGLTKPGVDRIAALNGLLGVLLPRTPAPTMDDPAFN